MQNEWSRTNEINIKKVIQYFFFIDKYEMPFLDLRKFLDLSKAIYKLTIGFRKETIHFTF